MSFTLNIIKKLLKIIVSKDICAEEYKSRAIVRCGQNETSSPCPRTLLCQPHCPNTPPLNNCRPPRVNLLKKIFYNIYMFRNFFRVNE